MFCWGGTLHGELGLGGVEFDQIYTPELSSWSQANKVVLVGCGENHTLFLTKEGKIYSCGSNDFGQLGHGLPGKRPQILGTLESYVMEQVACGAAHSLAINEWGQVFSWGAGDCGQLGLEFYTPSQPTPKIVRKLASMQACQIACGYYHTLVLMKNGELYSWGSNEYGQLGLGLLKQQCPSESKPVLLKSLAGVPFCHIACGGYHSFAITKSGAVYGWGKNECGQLGLNDKTDRLFPTLLKNFRSIPICRVACGEDFSVFLSIDGGVFACGANRYGQLGHGDNRDEWLPKKIVELMGSEVVQVACGRRHMLVATSSGRLHACGLAGSGQLAMKPSVISYVASPRVVNLQEYSDNTDKKVYRIFAGGDRCFVTLIQAGNTLYDSKAINLNHEILSINIEKMRLIQQLLKNDVVEQDMLCYLETVFKSLACLNGSFLNKTHYYCNSKNSGVDFDNVRSAFAFIFETQNSSARDVIFASILGCIKTLNSNPPDVEALRCFVTLPMYHEMMNPIFYSNLQSPFAKAFIELKPAPLKLLSSWYLSIPKDYFLKIINLYKYIVNRYLKTNSHEMGMKEEIYCVFEALTKLHRINESNAFHKRAPPEAFYILNLAEHVDIRQDYVSWLSNGPSGHRFYLCNYPFLFDALCKTTLLELDQAIQMHAAMNQAATFALATMLQGGLPPCQFLFLEISRENIVADTLSELSRYGGADLKKPLKVKFHGEEAEDAGGVRKEFFLLLLREILDPKYGMFHYYPESRNIWFAEESFEDEKMYFLIGIICGLAIYNFTIIDISFPLALYKKILKAPLTLEDLEELDPTVTNSLQSLLDYDGDDVEDVFGLTFEISREVYGSVKLCPLKEGGGEIPVTAKNKDEFVELYVDYVFNESIQLKFNAFSAGFCKVCGGKIFGLFQPQELMMLVVGNENYDWKELQEVASYRGVYNPQHQVIQMFWEVFYELSEEEKKKFLLFLTGCDRVPIQGMKAIKITIEPTNDDKFLPVAHTCFNILDLPTYSTKEKLKYKLLQAIQQTRGFSLV